MNNLNKININSICIAPLFKLINLHNIFLYNLFIKNIKIYIGMIHTSSFLSKYNYYYSYLKEISKYNISIQFVGNNYKDLYKCIKLINIFKFSEINFNVGCPSLCANKCNFGFYLMNDINTIKNCLNSISDSVNYNVILSIKHRLYNINDNINFCYNYMLDFIGNISLYTKCNKFIIHARSILNNNFSTNLNLKKPNLYYDIVYKLKKDLSHLNIVINGDIKSILDIKKHLNYVDSIMIGRGIYFNPLFLFYINKFIKNKNYLFKYENLLNNNFIFFKKNKISKYILFIFYKIYNYIFYQFFIKNINPYIIIKSIYNLFNNISYSYIFRKRILLSCTIFNKFKNYLEFINFIFKDFI